MVLEMKFLRNVERVKKYIEKNGMVTERQDSILKGMGHARRAPSNHENGFDLGGYASRYALCSMLFST